MQALRDEPVALAEQLSSLAARDGTELTVTGDPRPLTADAGLALYRAAQEAVTNARKHAPGAPVSIVSASTRNRRPSRSPTVTALTRTRK